MKLYGFPPTRTIRALWVLRELEVDFEYVQVDVTKGEHRRPEFLAVNPAGKVPVLVDGDFVLNESVAIVLYLAEKHPQKGFLPANLRARAQVYRWLLFTATELEQPVWRIARHTHGYPIEKRLAAEIPLARQDFLEMAAVMEEHLETRPVLVGENVTVADFVAAYTLDMASMVHLLETLPKSAGVHGADVRTAQGAAAHRRGVREPPRLRSGSPPANGRASRRLRQRAFKDPSSAR